MTSLADSYEQCRDVARQARSNFVLAFWLLPRAKRAGMEALYAFFRRTDDLADNVTPAAQRIAALEQWRTSLDRARLGTFDDPLLPAVADTVQRFAIPPEHLHAVITGVAMDCTAAASPEPRFQTFAELENYCEHVASAVGLACIHVWGYRDAAAFEPARKCGIAFQLTNILRDLKEDAAEGRVYLPREDFERFGYSPANLLAGVVNDAFHQLMQFEIARAETYYRDALALVPMLEPGGRRIFGAMLTSYGELLEQMKQRDAVVLERRIRLSRVRKLAIIARWLLWCPRKASP